MVKSTLTIQMPKYSRVVPVKVNCSRRICSGRLATAFGLCLIVHPSLSGTIASRPIPAQLCLESGGGQAQATACRRLRAGSFNVAPASPSHRRGLVVPARANPERDVTSRRGPHGSAPFAFIRGLAMAKIIETATGALALTFDDVLLQPGHSEVMPGETDISTRIAGDIELSTCRSCRRRWIRSPNRGWPSPWRRPAASASSTATCRRPSRPSRSARSRSSNPAWSSTR